jgi:hypothetical protein
MSDVAVHRHQAISLLAWKSTSTLNKIVCSRQLLGDDRFLRVHGRRRHACASAAKKTKSARCAPLADEYPGYGRDGTDGIDQTNEWVMSASGDMDAELMKWRLCAEQKKRFLPQPQQPLSPLACRVDVILGTTQHSARHGRLMLLHEMAERRMLGFQGSVCLVCHETL